MYFKILGFSLLSSFFILSGCASTQSVNTSNIKTQIAVEHIRLGNIDQAKTALDDALQRNPNNAMANMMLGVTLQLVGTSESLISAEPFFVKAQQLDPTNAQIRNNYGQYLFISERFEDAIAQFKIASDTIGYAGRDVALNNLGQSYLKLNNLPEAKKYFLRALAVNQNNPESILGLAETNYLMTDSDSAADIFHDYVTQIGRARLDAKALWLGIRIDRMNNNMISMREYIEELEKKFPRSPEYQKYNSQKNSLSIWR